jgi:hypothetical protein
MAGHPILLHGGQRDGQVHVLEQDSGVLEFRSAKDEESALPDADYVLTEQTVELPDGMSAQVAVFRGTSSS